MSQESPRDENEAELGSHPLTEKQMKASEIIEFSEEQKTATREILDALMNQEIGHIERFEAEKGDAAFPWTKIQLGELTDALKQQTHVEKAGPKKLIFTFGSTRAITTGHPFMFAEEGLRQVVKRLPKALKENDADDMAAYTLGSPMNVWGHCSEEFTEKMKSDPFEALGALYAEFIMSELKKYPDVRTVELIGVSMGTNMAMKAAEKMLAAGIVRKVGEDGGVPSLRIRALVPVGIDKPIAAKPQIALGFFADGFIEVAQRPWHVTIAKQENAYYPKLEKKLGWSGLNTPNPEEEIRRKKDSIKSLLMHLVEGTTIPEGIKIDTIRGIRDLTTYRIGHHFKARAQRKKADGTLGAPITKNTSTQREWSLRNGHAPAYFNVKSAESLRRAADALLEVRERRE